MRIRKEDGNLICTACGLPFPEADELCMNCFVPHFCTDAFDALFFCEKRLWPDMIACIVKSLESSVPKLTLEKVRATSSIVDKALKEIGDSWKTIKVA